MKLYKTSEGIIIEKERALYLLEGRDWDRFVNDDDLRAKMTGLTERMDPVPDAVRLLEDGLQAPIQSQEVWASGVTYYNSKLAREAESRDAGGGQFYARVYQAERPELFFKATRHRTVGSGGKVAIREDSTWDVPEPELTLAITSSGKIIGYTIGNDMSSRSIEGDNPLYLPQAKSYDGCAGIGPGIYVTDEPLSGETVIRMNIIRSGKTVFEGSVPLDQMKRTVEELVSWLYRACSFPHGCLLMTGTGIVPPADFTLQSDDEIQITIDPIGTLVNSVG
ncbi:fumarylacetoacetate hydrolase family protein [Fodinibius roseus]